MLKLKLRELLSVYQKLPYIIFRQKYLIPQPPISHRYCNTIYDRYNILNVYKKWLPELVDEKLIERANKQEERKALVSQYFQEVNRRRNRQKQKLEKYYESFIFPLQRHQITNPAFLYYNENKEVFENYWKKNNKKYNMADVYTIFNELTVQTKIKYEEKAKAKHQLTLKIAQQLTDKYKIPDLTKAMPHILYTKQKHGQGSAQYFKEYKTIPQSEKKIYKEKASNSNKQKYTVFMDFLKAKNLTYDQFKLIKRTCEEMEVVKSKLKEIKKEQKKQIGNNLEIQQSLNKWENQALADLIKIKAQPKEITQQDLPLQNQQNLIQPESIQDPIEEQSHKPNQQLVKDHNQLNQFQDQNWDILQQVDIFEIKKKALANKTNKNKKKNKEK